MSYIDNLFQDAFLKFRTDATLYDHIDLFPEELFKIYFHFDQLEEARDISWIKFNEDIDITPPFLFTRTKEPKMPISRTRYFCTTSALCSFRIALASSIFFTARLMPLFYHFSSAFTEHFFNPVTVLNLKLATYMALRKKNVLNLLQARSSGNPFLCVSSESSSCMTKSNKIRFTIPQAERSYMILSVRNPSCSR